MISYIKYFRNKIKDKELFESYFKYIIKDNKIKINNIEYVDHFEIVKNNFDKSLINFKFIMKSGQIFEGYFEDSHGCNCCSDLNGNYKLYF